jgi:hypothetical protein
VHTVFDGLAFVRVLRVKDHRAYVQPSFLARALLEGNALHMVTSMNSFYILDAPSQKSKLSDRFVNRDKVPGPASRLTSMKLKSSMKVSGKLFWNHPFVVMFRVFH